MGHCLYRSFVADLILATTLANTSWWWLTHTRVDKLIVARGWMHSDHVSGWGRSAPPQSSSPCR